MNEDPRPKSPFHINHGLIILATVVMVIGLVVVLTSLDDTNTPIKASDDSAPVTLDAPAAAEGCLDALDPLTGEMTAACETAMQSASYVAEIAHAKKIDQTCPPPTKKQGSLCVLTGDIVIDSPLELASFTHLNCKGYKISPSAKGVLGNVASRSVPEVGLFMRENYGSKIQNCVLDGFDFGIYAIKSKLTDEMIDDPGALSLLGSKILGNTINARFGAVALLSVDNTEIKNNSLSYATIGGYGLLIERDSDRNVAADNDISATLSSTIRGARHVPGSSGASNPVFTAGGAAYIVQIEGAKPALANVVVDGTLYQVVTDKGSGSSDDNRFEGNAVSFLGAPEVGLNMTGNPARTVVRGNVFNKMTNGIQMGIQADPTRPRQFPGSCSLDASRRCLSNADCMIAGVDTASKGTCSLPPPDAALQWYPQDTLLEDNTFNGPHQFAISNAGENTVIRGNAIKGPMSPDIPTTQWAGISIRGKWAIPTATVTRNTVSNVVRALRLDRLFQQAATSFGAKVHLNDFQGGTKGVITDAYTLPTDLSVLERGNYWGRSCDDSDGFRASDEPDADGKTDTSTASVTDSHPYGVPVAATPDGSLPAPCL